MFELTTQSTGNTNVVIHSRLDTKAYEQVRDGFTPLEEMSNTTSLPGADSLVENAFCTFYRTSPTLTPVESLNGTQRVQRAMLEQMMQTGEYKRVRASGTSGHQFSSALATASVTQKMIESVDEETARKLQQLQQHQQEQQKLEKQAQQLEQLAGQVADQADAQAMQDQAQQNHQQAQQAEEQATQLESEIADQIKDIADNARVAARKGLEQAEQQIDDMNRAIRAFTVGIGSNPGQEHLLLNLEEKMQLASMLIQHPKLARIAELAGHVVDIALQYQKQKFLYPPTQVTGIELGNNIQRIVPSELVYLARPELVPFFAKQYTEKALVQRKMIGHRTLGKGPIQFALDGSGSMKDPFTATDLKVYNKEKGSYESPTKEEYAKAVVIALLFIAARQKRDMVVMHFSSGGDMKQFTFIHKQYTHKDVLACMAFFFNGGTNYNAWMRQSVENAKLAKFKQSSLIVLSDGDSSMNEEENRAYNKERAERDLDALGILVATPQEIEQTQGDKKLAQVTDDVVSVTDFTSLKKAEAAMFSI